MVPNELNARFRRSFHLKGASEFCIEKYYSFKVPHFLFIMNRNFLTDI
jgi:hypothetical protein